jgi:hypothetical protein
MISVLADNHQFRFDLDDEVEFCKLALSGEYQSHSVVAGGFIMMRASDVSLEKIKEMFTNLPMGKNLKVVTWTGDHATFILENLRTYAFELVRSE